MRPGDFYNISNSYFQKFDILLPLKDGVHNSQPYFCVSADKKNPDIFWCVPLPDPIEEKSSLRMEKNNNNLEAESTSGKLGEIPLVYGTLRGREALVKAGENSPNKNNNVADSYLGELNLGLDFMQLGVFARKYTEGSLNDADLNRLIYYKDDYFDQSMKYHERQMSAVSPEANRELLSLMLNEKKVQNILVQLSGTQEELFNAEKRKEALSKFNRLTRGFFSVKTKLALEKTLEGDGQIYFSLNEVVMDKEKNIDFSKLKEVFDENSDKYNTVTSDELRFTLENYLNHPNLKFLLDKQVIELPVNIKKDIQDIMKEKKKAYDELFWTKYMLPVTEQYNCGKAVLERLHIFFNDDLKNMAVNSVRKAMESPANGAESLLSGNALKIRTELLKEIGGNNSFITKTDLKGLLREAAAEKKTPEPKRLTQSLSRKPEKQVIPGRRSRSL